MDDADRPRFIETLGEACASHTARAAIDLLGGITYSLRMVALIRRETEAWCSADLFKNGFGQVVVARFKSGGNAEDDSTVLVADVGE